MIRSRNEPAEYAKPFRRTRCHSRGRTWRLKLLYLTRPRLISNLLALVALFSIGFV